MKFCFDIFTTYKFHSCEKVIQFYFILISNYYYWNIISKSTKFTVIECYDSINSSYSTNIRHKFLNKRLKDLIGNCEIDFYRYCGFCSGFYRLLIGTFFFCEKIVHQFIKIATISKMGIYNYILCNVKSTSNEPVVKCVFRCPEPAIIGNMR